MSFKGNNDFKFFVLPIFYTPKKFGVYFYAF